MEKGYLLDLYCLFFQNLLYFLSLADIRNIEKSFQWRHKQLYNYLIALIKCSNACQVFIAKGVFNVEPLFSVPLTTRVTGYHRKRERWIPPWDTQTTIKTRLIFLPLPHSFIRLGIELDFYLISNSQMFQHLFWRLTRNLVIHYFHQKVWGSTRKF